jgi:acyl phosphate:glycerol-3-phosphate acyltransferase
MYFYLFPILAYLLGSMPFGLMLARIFAGADLRRLGSGNIGATNVRRVAGNRPGLAVLLLDAGKGALPALMALSLVDPAGTLGAAYAGLVALCAFAGHLFPVYLKFRTGGKGVATAAGAFLVLAPAALGLSLLVFVLLVCLTDRVSVGSLAAAGFLPLAVHLTARPLPLTVCAVIAGALIVWRHQANIRRLLTGREPRAGI